MSAAPVVDDVGEAPMAAGVLPPAATVSAALVVGDVGEAPMAAGVLPPAATVSAAPVVGEAPMAAGVLPPAATVSAALVVDDVGERGGVRALAPAWSALLEASARPEWSAHAPFARPEWFAVTASFLAAAPRRLRLLVAHRGAELHGVLPLVAERRSVSGVPARVLRSLSDDHSQRFDLAASGDEAVRALWAHLAADPSWDVLELRDVPDGSPGAGRLHALAAEAGCPVHTWASQRSPYLALPSTAEALDASLDAKFRSNLRRRKKKLAAEVGEVRLERIDAKRGADLTRALDEGFALERSGWKGAEGTAIACDAPLRARYLSLAQVFAARGELALYFLVAGGRRVAFHYAIEAGATYYLFKPGYDETLARYGLGHLLTWEVARDLAGRGARELDFLGEDMEWKREWTSAVRAHAFRYVFRPTLFGRALHAWKTRGVPLARAVAHRVQAYRSQSAAPEATAAVAPGQAAAPVAQPPIA